MWFSCAGLVVVIFMFFFLILNFLELHPNLLNLGILDKFYIVFWIVL